MVLVTFFTVWGQSHARNKGAPTLLISNVLSQPAENGES